MELLAGEDEQACAAIMDKCLYRLEQEGEMELIAALLSGDETTFKALPHAGAGAGAPAGCNL